MMCSEHDSLDFINSSLNGPYNSSIASSASSSSASVWSETSSQASDDTSISTCISDASERCDSYAYIRPSMPSQSDVLCNQILPTACWRGQPQQTEVPQELRQNPRRTSSSATSRTGCPPSLTRQSDRKVNFVDTLVDSSTQIVEAIWPLSSVFHRQELGNKAVLPLRTFIQETLRRSRTSYSTLQVALYYLILIKPHVPKHDFTMEQPDEVHANRVLQCGRRMFLAALILASKYLQDRNYSARAWSKISGLVTQEINQNEMAFLIAVKWKLHITDDVFKRWTEIVLRYTPPQPPSGSVCSQISEQQNQDWKNLILSLEPGLGNIEDLIPLSPLITKTRDSTPIPPLSNLCAQVDKLTYTSDPSTPKTYNIPYVMEPAPATVHTPGRLAPALGLLPTPRLTPQSIGFSTPAASAATCLLSSKGSMGFAMAQAANVTASQNLDRWPGSLSSSPLSYVSTRRSSLANSISTASSPESMISDSSRTSRSSSISSASSLASAPSTKLDVQARCRYAKLCSERYSLRPVIASVPEDYEENCITSSPESYTGPVSKDLVQMSLETPLARGCELDETANAARALQQLQNQLQNYRPQPRPSTKLSTKRSRPLSIDNSLQENVREMLSSQCYEEERSDVTVRGLPSTDLGNQRTPVLSNGGRKRMCCSYDARSFIPSIHPAVGGPGGPGMWDGILN
ncbi:G1/S-specific cyclin pas1 [Daldinia childiae]|uniref:G1/S-specific cyclin pas1 n=1 Tax=Daldinia childiae TaxID=326645 RepID=UPI00144663CB|nr:G1/S-specific cyclin pas1 [Daldinia childiae]KAF3064189.1 G1/S-specific cyclin pas1 [Daldinia childiae]